MSIKEIVGKPISGLSLPSPIEEGDEISNLSLILNAIDSLSSEGEQITVDDVTQEISFVDGEYVGQRKLITLETITTGGDVVNLDPANIEDLLGVLAATVVFDAEGEYLYVEWHGDSWRTLDHTATITT